VSEMTAQYYANGFVIVTSDGNAVKTELVTNDDKNREGNFLDRKEFVFGSNGLRTVVDAPPQVNPGVRRRSIAGSLKGTFRRSSTLVNSGSSLQSSAGASGASLMVANALGASGSSAPLISPLPVDPSDKKD